MTSYRSEEWEIIYATAWARHRAIGRMIGNRHSPDADYSYNVMAGCDCLYHAVEWYREIRNIGDCSVAANPNGAGQVP